MNKVQEQIGRTRGIVGLIIEAAGPQEEWMPIDAKIAEIALETADTMESMQARIKELKAEFSEYSAKQQETYVADMTRQRDAIIRKGNKIKLLQARIELLEKVVEAAERTRQPPYSSTKLFQFDQALAALKEQTL